MKEKLSKTRRELNYEHKVNLSYEHKVNEHESKSKL